MIMLPTNDLRVEALEPLISPRELKDELPMTEEANQTVVDGRQTIQNILNHDDQRLLVVVGPCSIHDPEAALEYARRIADLRQELSDSLFIVMRVYFEKPRTTVGWKGLINDPHLDGSYDIESGLKIARKLLLEVAELGVPSATEFLDPYVPQYIADLVSWAAIGARTTESQTHREMASGLSMPVGYKNATDGSLQVALDAMQAARQPHSFLGITSDGYTAVVRTRGNRAGHVVLRGGRSGSNYDPESIASAVQKLTKAGLPAALMVDCSHANSEKQYSRQDGVAREVATQRAGGNEAIIGLMLESNLFEGNQPASGTLETLKYGVSITDACISWETTEKLLRDVAAKFQS